MSILRYVSILRLLPAEPPKGEGSGERAMVAAQGLQTVCSALGTGCQRAYEVTAVLRKYMVDGQWCAEWTVVYEQWCAAWAVVCCMGSGVLHGQSCAAWTVVW